MFEISLIKWLKWVNQSFRLEEESATLQHRLVCSGVSVLNLFSDQNQPGCISSQRNRGAPLTQT